MTERFVRDNNAPFVASQSAIRCLADCERRVQHRYVLRTPVDADYVEPTYFRFGSALHRLLEISKHDYSLMTPEHIEGMCMEFRLDFVKDAPKLVAMCREYAKVRDYSETIHGLEVEVVTGDWVMYADMVVSATDIVTGVTGWKLVDVKSASELDPTIRMRMAHDNQVNLYTSHADLFAKKLGLDPSKFLGFEYREIEKPKERLKKSESVPEYIERMKPAVRFTLMRPQDLNTAHACAQLGVKLVRMRELFSGAEPTENRSQCLSKGSTCPYWSQCNGGKTYTQIKMESVTNGSENL